jgi:hypothetical protein
MSLERKKRVEIQGAKVKLRLGFACCEVDLHNIPKDLRDPFEWLEVLR